MASEMILDNSESDSEAESDNESDSEAKDDDLMVSEKDSEEESVEQNLDFGVEKLDASEAKDDTLLAPEEDTDSLFDDNAGLESGESLTQEDASHAVSDVINNQVQEIDGKFQISTNFN